MLPRFDLADLQLFVHVLETGTLTAAAARSHITLAAANERVQHMERQLRIPLLEREGLDVRPTPAGHTLGQHAREMLQQLSHMQSAMGQFSNGLQGQVRIHGSCSAVSQHLPPTLTAYLQNHPNVAVELHESDCDSVVRATAQGLCDIGIASDCADTSAVATEVWRPEPLSVVLPASHALARRVSIKLAEVVGDDWIGCPQHSALLAQMDQQAQRLGHPLRWRVQVQQLETMCQLVAQGLGVAAMPAAAARRLATRYGVRALALQDSWAQHQLLLCTRRDARLPHAAQLLLEHLRAQAQPARAS